MNTVSYENELPVLIRVHNASHTSDVPDCDTVLHCLPAVPGIHPASRNPARPSHSNQHTTGLVSHVSLQHVLQHYNTCYNTMATKHFKEKTVRQAGTG